MIITNIILCIIDNYYVLLISDIILSDNIVSCTVKEYILSIL